MKKNRYLDCELSLECGKSALLKFVCVSVEREKRRLRVGDGKRRRRNTPHFSGEISLPLFAVKRGRERGSPPWQLKRRKRKFLPQKASMDVSLPSFLCLGNFKRIAQLKFITSNGTHLADLASYP